MEVFWKAIAVVILTVILGVAIGKTEKDIAVVLSVVACCIILATAVGYLSDVIVFLWRLGSSTDESGLLINTMLKISAVALTTELTGLISADAGNGSLAKAVEILGTAFIMFLSLPLFESFFSIVQDILGFL